MKSDNLQLRELVVAREGVGMLPAMSLSVAAGEILLVRGRNGSGKSSLLKTMAGLLKPASGEVCWGEHALGRHPMYPAGLLYLGHRRGVDSSLSVQQNVAFWAKAYRQRELLDVALHYFDLEDIAQVPVHTLSAGWQQRVALARLIAQPGALWLLDEPTANLDEEGLALLHSLIQTRCEQGGIVVVASHMPLQGEKVRLLDLNQMSQQGDSHPVAGGAYVEYLH